MLYVDVVANIGCKPAADITRKGVVDLIWSVIDRGANVQAGTILKVVAGLRYSPNLKNVLRLTL
ncbi:hypothetical protein [uncultured Marinobacter sp.]|uniref:hypothetical protein n=1 Tax=uncultured Marinobacter sp. TaxID=187379 RepID=UPI0030DA73DA|tara:strand:- start:360 stop:551 length:192 start_codon:yes stop_codon:yes gene_type:complete